MVRLTEIFRQAGQSWIVRAAHADQPRRDARIGAGRARAISTSSRPRRRQPILERIVTLVRERIPARFGLDPFRDVQVLTPMNRSELGVAGAERTPAGGAQSAARRRRGGALRLDVPRRRQGAADARTTTNKEVFNGDIGRIRRIDETEQELVGRFRRPAGGLRFRRAGRAGAGLRADDPQSRRGRSIPRW